MRRSVRDFTPRLCPSATARPQPALERLWERAGRLGAPAGIGIRALEPRLEAHQLVAAKGVNPDAPSCAALGQGRIESRLPWPQSVHRDDQVAGSDARLLRRAAFEHMRDGGVIALRSEERRVGKECRSRWSPYH